MKNLEKEKELLESAKKDKKNFNNLYKYFLNDVYRYSYTLLNDQHDAEDITSKVFIEFYKKIDGFEWKNVSLTFWLLQTARNFCYEQFRIPKPDNLDETFHIKDEMEISFVDQIMNLELVEVVKKEIETLKPIERELINLRIWEGYDFKEIAEIQNSTTNTSIKRFHRAIEKLKESLQSKGLQSLIALPVLFTTIKQVGSYPAYAASLSLVSSEFKNGNLIKSSLIQGNKVAFTAKAAFTLVAGTVAIISVIGATLVLAMKNNSQDNKINLSHNKLNLTPTTIIPTNIATLIPTTSTIKPPTAITNSPTNIPNTNYYWNYIDISFSYPNNWVLGQVEDYNITYSCSYAPEKFLNSKEDCINDYITPKTLELRSPSGSKIEFYFLPVEGNTCGGDMDCGELIESASFLNEGLFTNTNSRIRKFKTGEFQYRTGAVGIEFQTGTRSIWKTYKVSVFSTESDLEVIKVILQSFRLGS